MGMKAHHNWRQLCEIAVLELDPAKRLERILTARYAILDFIEDGSAKTSSEQAALRKALATLDTLRSYQSTG